MVREDKATWKSNYFMRIIVSLNFSLVNRKYWIIWFSKDMKFHICYFVGWNNCNTIAILFNWTYIWLKWESTWWLLQLMVSGQLLFVGHGLCRSYTLIANMAHHSVGAWDKLHEKESSQALMFCFDNASSEIVDLIGFILLCVQVAVLLNATRS